ncbi:MAG: DEAD/DEAH box helicase, partial [Sulfolobus sp.]|nr:DEAD/DEAH box helicase [Sulfolobus sp.]
MSLRPLMKEALEAAKNDEIPIVIAPTGYGKTIATLPIHEYVKKNNLARGVIHVSPLRTLVEKVFEDIFCCEGGIQAYGLNEKKKEKKSPYLLRSPLAITLDSFILSLYRLPIPEIIKIEKGYSAGHYYPTLSAIKSSLIIFDEAHLALESNERTGYEALVAGVTALAKMGVRFMIETATLRPNVIGRLVSQMRGAKVKILLLGEEGSNYVKKLNDAVKGRAEIRVMEDDKFT